MEATIKIIFEEINGKKVNEKVLQKVPQLLKVTENTVKILCGQIDKYFQDNKIKSKTTFIISK